MDNTVTIIPAAPGHSVLEPVYGDTKDDITIFASEVVAWQITTKTQKMPYVGLVFQSFAEPITASGETIETIPVIKRPDGRMWIEGWQWFDTEEQLLEYWRDNRK